MQLNKYFNFLKSQKKSTEEVFLSTFLISVPSKQLSAILMWLQSRLFTHCLLSLQVDNWSFSVLIIFFFFFSPHVNSRASSMAQPVKNLPAMQQTQELWVQSLGQEDPLEEKMATLSSILA